MRFTLTHLARLALVPALSAGVIVGSQAQVADNKRNPSAPGVSSSKATVNSAVSVRASELIGKTVRNPKGENLGQIKDMIVNMNTGEVRYAVLEFDKGIFQGEKLFAVPTKLLRTSPERNEVVYDMRKERLEQAGVNRSEWDTASRDPGYMGRMDKAWGIAQPSDNARAFRVSDLLGKDVTARNNDDIGEIKDLVVNMNAQKVHYAVLEFDPGWASAEKKYAFPLRAFNLGQDKDKLMLDIDKPKLQSMKSLPNDYHANLNNRQMANDIDGYLVAVFPVTNVSSNSGNAGASNAGASNTRASGAAPASRFDQLDTNKDGVLSRQEFNNNNGQMRSQK